jgi:hypothetical protein
MELKILGLVLSFGLQAVPRQKKKKKKEGGVPVDIACLFLTLAN